MIAHFGYSSPKTSWLHNRWTTLTIFTLLYLVCCVDRFILGALILPIKSEFHLTDEQLGRLNLIFVLAYLAVVPVAGFLGDRFPRKWFIFISLIVWSVASIGSGLVASFGLLLLWRALVGVGEGVYSSLSPGWIADTFGPNLRSFAFAVVQSMGQVGAWVAYGGGSAIAEASSWHNAFFIAGLPGLVLALVFILLREPKRGEAEEGGQPAFEKPSRREVAALFQDKNYLLYLAAYALRMIAVGGLFFWGAVLLHRRFGISNHEATNFIGAAYFFAGTPGIFIGGILAGWLARQVRGAYAFWLVGGEVFAAIAVACALAYAHDLTTAKILLLTQMFFAGNSWGVISPVLFEFAALRTRNLAVALGLAASTLSTAFFGSELIGALSDRFGIGHALVVVPVAYVLAALCWLLLGVRRTRQAPLPTPLPLVTAGSLLQSA